MGMRMFANPSNVGHPIIFRVVIYNLIQSLSTLQMLLYYRSNRYRLGAGSSWCLYQFSDIVALYLSGKDYCFVHCSDSFQIIVFGGGQRAGLLSEFDGSLPSFCTVTRDVSLLIPGPRF